MHAADELDTPRLMNDENENWRATRLNKYSQVTARGLVTGYWSLN